MLQFTILGQRSATLFSVLDKGLPKKIVVSVKAGENIGLAMIRDSAHVIDREKAALGVFINMPPDLAPET